MLEKSTSTLNAGEHIRLRSDVRRVSRPGSVLLIRAQGNPLRVSATVDKIWPLLVDGVQVEDLVVHFERTFPAAGDVRIRVSNFAEQLRQSGFLEDSPGFTNKRKLRQPPTVDLDGLARRVAALLVQVPRPLAVLGMIVIVSASTVGSALVLIRPGHPRFIDMVRSFSWAGLAFVLLFLMPLHEIGHAVACRLAGVRAGKLTVGSGAFGFPRLFLLTPDVLLLTERRRRLLVTCGGAICEIVVTGITAWALLIPGFLVPFRQIITFVFLFCILSLIAGTNPVHESDGSHVLEIFLNDDALRCVALQGRPSRFTSLRNVRIYRAACIAHVLLSLMLLWYLVS